MISDAVNSDGATTATMPVGGRPDSDDSTDAALERAADGDPAAWEVIVERYADRVWSAARRPDLPEPAVARVCRLTWLRLTDRLPVMTAERLSEWLTETAGREARREARLLAAGSTRLSA